MGATVDWIVDLDASQDESEALAIKVKTWLITREVVSAVSSPERTYGGGELLMRGPCAAKWDACEIGTISSLCGLEVVTKRKVFHTGDNGIQALQCTDCGGKHDPDVIPWSDAVGAWFSGEGSDVMRCPACDAQRSIVDWRFLNCEWGFGNLGFGFWNWPISERLAQELSVLLGHRCRLVHEHI